MRDVKCEDLGANCEVRNPVSCVTCHASQVTRHVFLWDVLDSNQ